MHIARTFLALAAVSVTAFPATFGTVVAPAGGAAYADLVLDESRSSLYLVNTNVNEIDVYNLKTKTFGNPILTDAQPVSAALSRDHSRLYVTTYTNDRLDIIDLTKTPAQLVTQLALPTSPEGVAVGADGRVLITAVAATGTANTLMIYDPTVTSGSPLSSVAVAPPPSTSPVLPPPSGRTFLSYRSRLLASPDGKWIVGVNGPTATTKVVFVYEAASGTVLRSRNVTNLSTVLSIAPDGSKFMAGPVLFDLNSLQVLAQENTANAAFVFPTGTANSFNTQATQGGSVFSPDGTVVYAAFNIAPIDATKANVTQLLLNDPQNLLINLGLQLPENMAGKMTIDAAGANVYSISDSGFTILPVSTIYQQPIASPQSQSVVLIKDTCGVLNAATASDAVNNIGKGKFTIAVTPYTTTTTAVGPGGPGGAIGPGFGGGAFGPATATTSITTPAPTAQAVNNPSPQINFSYSPTAGTNPGTIGPSDFVLTSTEAINIPGNIHAYQNYRDSVSGGMIAHIPINAQSTYGPADILLDSTRKLLYIANSGFNRLEVFDLQRQAFVSTIKVGQLPVGMAFGSDGNTLYVANAGGESISIVDLTKQAVTGSVVFPAFPINAAVSIAAPVAIAATVRGPQFVMNDGTTGGTLWKVDGTQAIPRALNAAIFPSNSTKTVSGGTSTTNAFWSLTVTPDGQYMMLLTGTGAAYLYDYTVDDFTVTRTILTTPITGFRGPVTAGPQGLYYAVGGTFLNASLTPIQGSLNGFSASGRPVAAVAAISANQVALFTEPTRTSATSVVTDAGMVELYNPLTGASQGSAAALEGPSTFVIGANGAVTQFSRTMAIDATTSTAYMLTATGLSIVSLTPAPAATALRPSVNAGGIVNLGDYTPGLAPGGLMTLFGKNLGSSATANPPLPTLLGGMCVTLNNTPIPLEMTSPGQINAQIPVTLAAGKYPLVIRSIGNQAISSSSTVTVAKYAPAVLIAAPNQPAILHSDGSYVTQSNPAKRDETLTIYATGMGVTTGGPVTTGAAAPSSPVANTAAVSVYFGNVSFKQSQMIVHSSSLVPGMVGIAQISVTVPGFHTRGSAVPVTIKVGGIGSSTTGPVAPVIAVN